MIATMSACHDSLCLQLL